jgi:TetR/AcrR family transcriptional regulator, transcriptional repressor for nem operon
VRTSKEQAAQTRAAIVAAAADYIGRAGISGSSLAEMMSAAGLTHGGFYRHFQDKEQLVSEAVSAAGDKVVGTISRNMRKGGINSAVESYLSTSHRDSTTPVCPFAAVGSELRFSGKDTKAVATEVLERVIAALSAEAQGSESARRDAIAAFSTMIGAMVLARVAGRTKLSSEILGAAKDYLHAKCGSLL